MFVVPITVIIAWGRGIPLGLLFDPLESVALFITTLLVQVVLNDGKVNWGEGMILMVSCVSIFITDNFLLD